MTFVAARPMLKTMVPNDSNDLKPWKVLQEKPALQTPFFRISKQELETPWGARPTYYIHDSDDGVLCVCVTDDKRVLIEKQYRPAVAKVSYDYPAGKAESVDANFVTAMKRELKEETGYEATSFKELAVIDASPGFSNQRIHIFLVQGLAAGVAEPEDTERIFSEFVPASQILKMITEGKISCAFCLSATLLAFNELGWPLGFGTPGITDKV